MTHDDITDQECAWGLWGRGYDGLKVPDLGYNFLFCFYHCRIVDDRLSQSTFLKQTSKQIALDFKGPTMLFLPEVLLCILLCILIYFHSCLYGKTKI